MAVGSKKHLLVSNNMPRIRAITTRGNTPSMRCCGSPASASSTTSGLSYVSVTVVPFPGSISSDSLRL